MADEPAICGIEIVHAPEQPDPAGELLADPCALTFPVGALSARDVYKAESAMANHVISGSERIIRALVEAGL